MILKALFVILALTAVGSVRATVTNVIDAVARRNATLPPTRHVNVTRK